MIKDPIVEEIHKFRLEYAKRFSFDVHAIYEDLKRAQESAEKAGRKIVTREPKPKKTAA